MFKKFKSIPIEARSSMAYAICNILQNCLAFITMPIFTRLLSTEQYGEYTIYSSWMALLVIFVTLNLPYGSFSTAMIKFEDKRKEYIASVEMICVSLAVVFLVIYLPFHKLWNRLFDLPTYLVIVMVFEMLGTAGILFFSGKNMFEYKYKAVVAITMGNAILAPIIAYILVMNSDEKGQARILGYSAVNICVGGTIFLYNMLAGKKVFKKEYWKYALGFNLPLIFYYLSQVVFNQSDRIMINHYIGKSEAGIYGVAYTLAFVLTCVLNAINNSYVPWFYRKLKAREQKDNQKISCMIALLMAFLISGVIWLAPEIILVLSGEKYMSAIWIIPPVALSLLLLYYSQLFINVEFFFEKKGHLVFASIGAALINIVLNAILIPEFGFIAAGYTTLFSYLVFAIANYYAMRKVLVEQKVENDAYDIKLLILIFIVFGILSALAALLYNYMLIRYAVIVVVLLGLFFARRWIFNLINMLRNINKEG